MIFGPACGGSGDDTADWVEGRDLASLEVSRYETLQWTESTGTAASESEAASLSQLESGVVARFAPTADSRPWRAFSPGGTKDLDVPSIVEGGAATRLTFMPGIGEGKRIELDLPELEVGFNEVLIEIQLFGKPTETLHVEAYRRGELISESAPIKVKGMDGVQSVVVPMPTTDGLGLAPDSVKLILSARYQDTVGIAGITLVRRNWGASMPSLGRPSVQLSGDHFREASALRVGRKVEVSFDDSVASNSKDARLEFSVAQVPGLAKPGQRLALELVWSRGEKELLRETRDFGKTGDGGEEIGWNKCTQQLSELGERGSGPLTLSARFLPTGDDKKWELCWISPPVLAMPTPPEAAPPTVVLITSDTHRADHIGLVGDEPLVFTPELDKLGAHGVQFLNCFSSTNVTTPSHVALMTGTHPRDARIVSNRVRLSAQANTLAEHFQDAGYATFAVASVAHLMDPTSGLGQGFQRMEGPSMSARNADVSVNRALEWLRESKGLPVFLWLHLFDAHDPYGPPKPFSGKYYPKDQDPRDPDREWGLTPTETPGWIKGVTDPDFFYAEYRAEIDYLDSELSRLLGRPRVREGIVAFTADHGENFGDHDIWFSHGGLYPSTLHIPLLLRWPGCPARVRSDAPVRQMDLGRTLLNLSGLEEVDYPGRDLRWGIDEPSATSPRFFLSSSALSAGIEADGWLLNLSLKRHKLMRSQLDHPLGQVELYHIAEDPRAEVDVHEAHPERAKKLRARLIEWLGSSEGEGFAVDVGVSSEMEALLTELGYAQAEEEESTLWWRPEELDRDWESNPWRLKFED